MNGVCNFQVTSTDDLQIIDENEDNLQRAPRQLNEVCKTYNLNIFIKKTKTIKQWPPNAKTPYHVIYYCIINLQNRSHILITYVYYNVNNKVHRYQTVCDRSLKGKTRKRTQITFYKVMAVRILFYGNEAWVLTKKERSRIHAAAMEFLGSVEGYNE